MEKRKWKNGNQGKTEGYPEFICRIKEAASGIFGEGRIWFRTLLQNNGQPDEILEIGLEGTDTRAVLHLQQMYLCYRETGSMEACMEELQKLSIKSEWEKPEIRRLEQLLAGWENVRPHVYPALCNTGWNQEMLAGLPNREFLDLSVFYYVSLSGLGRGGATIKINREMAGVWGINEGALYQTAMKNQKKTPGRIKDIAGILGIEESPRPPIYILTSQEQGYGAGAVLNAGQLKEFSEKMGASLYLIPSSIYEFLLIPDLAGMKDREIGAIIREVNRSVVERQDLLSDHGYYFEKDTGEYRMCEIE